MCFTAVQLYRKYIKYAKHRGDSPEEIERLQKLLEEAEKLELLDQHYNAYGFNHPKLGIIQKMEDGFEMRQMHWGLIPNWTKSREDAYRRWNGNLNARGEEMEEKVSFKDSVQHSRCIFPIAGYFEHHHKGGKTFPFFIQRQDHELMLVGALSSKWVVPETGKVIESFAMVTTLPTEFLAEIHNNPKREESRMPLLLNPEDVLTWMDGDIEEVKELIKPNQEIELIAHTTKPILGKQSVGDTPDALEPHFYSELGQKSLFD